MKDYPPSRAFLDLTWAGNRPYVVLHRGSHTAPVFFREHFDVSILRAALTRLGCRGEGDTLPNVVLFCTDQRPQ